MRASWSATCSIRTTDVVITRSRILGSVTVRHPEDGYSFTISDSEVAVGGRMVTAIGNGNFTARRVGGHAVEGARSTARPTARSSTPGSTDRPVTPTKLPT